MKKTNDTQKKVEKIKVEKTNNKGMDELCHKIVDMVKDNPRFMGFDDIDAFSK